MPVCHCQYCYMEMDTENVKIHENVCKDMDSYDRKKIFRNAGLIEINS